MYSAHDTLVQREDIKVPRRDERWYTSFRLFLPEGSNVAARKRREKGTKMRSVKALALIFAMSIVCEFSSGTVLTRVTRTLPFDLSPWRWSGMFRTLWSGGRLWEWPRNSAEGLLRLVASPDTRKRVTFEFRPDDGPRASGAYQRRYGYRGERLIELLGSGFHPDGLRYQQPLPASILVPPPPPPPL